jgi:hypothetical protein
MRQTVDMTDQRQFERVSVRTPRRLSFFRFLQRYPLFLLALGPPIFKPPVVGVDTSQAHADIWNFVQVGFLFLIALRAVLRLATSRSTLIPRQSRSILKYAFFLGLLFVVSVTYSPGRTVSAEFCVLYFFTLICITEFIVDAYQNPPDWMQSLLQLRLIALLLFIVVLLTLPIKPALVLSVVPGAGIRLLGGAVAPVALICPMIAITSAYCFSHSLESKLRSTLFFLAGVAGVAITQVRGAEVSLVIVLVAVAIGWAKTSARAAYILIAGTMASFLLAGVVVALIGGGRVWNTFNRNQETASILTGSGRSGIWVSLVEHSMSHPQGLGYIAGMRTFHGGQYSTNLSATLNKAGGTDNSYMEVLADAGWLALALYLIMLTKVVTLGWRSAHQYIPGVRASSNMSRHAIRCAIFVLIFFLIEGMESSVFEIPLSPGFYLQNIVVAVIMGASASILLASRSSNAVSMR